MKMTYWLAAVLACGAASAACGQTAVAPPPRPAGSGPSLEVTMKFIQDKLSEIGIVTLVTSNQNTVSGDTGHNTITLEISNVTADANKCTIFHKWNRTNQGKSYASGTAYFRLGDVKDIMVKPYAQYQTEANANNGAPNWIVTSTNPPVMQLIARFSHRDVLFPEGALFPFTDADTADRVAKALTHAVELCGGGNKDPF
jgi:hypothetical protein